MTLKTIRPVLLLTIIFSAHHCSAQTQQEMNEQAVGMYNTSDQELNRVYRSVLREYKEDTTFLRRFREAQRIWLQFRDAKCWPDFPNGNLATMAVSTLFAGISTLRNSRMSVWQN